MSERTMIEVSKSTRDELAKVKYDSEASSYDEAIMLLLSANDE